MRENNNEAKLQCDHCRDEIRFGCDVLRVEKCVSGPRGVIPLGEAQALCSEQCVSRHFDQESVGDLPEVPRRIP